MEQFHIQRKLGFENWNIHMHSGCESKSDHLDEPWIWEELQPICSEIGSQDLSLDAKISPSTRYN